MRNVEYKSKYSDLITMAIAVPVMAFVIPIIFFGISFTHAPYYKWNMYIATICISLVMWIGNRQIMVWARKRYPSFSEVKKRLLVQSVWMLIYTLTASTVLGYADYYIEAVMLKIPIDCNLRLSDQMYSSFSASIFCTLVVIALFELGYFMRELKKSIEEKETLKRETLELQLNALKTQVNPHFLFNNLNTLSSLIPENQDQAIEFVQQLSRLYRHILEVKDEKLILLADELSVIDSYLFLLKTRFGNNLVFRQDIPEKYRHFYLVAPFCLQLLLENAIKHNVVSSQKPLYISIKTTDEKLIFKNNLQRKIQFQESTGLGLNNIKNRYKLLTTRPVEVWQSDNEFIVELPLLKQA